LFSASRIGALNGIFHLLQFRDVLFRQRLKLNAKTPPYSQIFIASAKSILTSTNLIVKSFQLSHPPYQLSKSADSIPSLTSDMLFLSPKSAAFLFSRACCLYLRQMLQKHTGGRMSRSLLQKISAGRTKCNVLQKQSAGSTSRTASQLQPPTR
jgi:hypothetical protein